VPGRIVNVEVEVTVSALQDQNILILGLGASGLAMARWCARQGAQITVADTRAAPPQLQALMTAVPAARYVGGEFGASLVFGSQVTAVFKSPGLSPKETQAVLDAAKQQGVSVGGELTLFAQALADLKVSAQYEPKVLAITGTNGKTTVTSLTRHLVAWAG
jgi:UDP-N-acetylmuramoylalanine--D-glutamate ligase